jgi:hypothetical protein
MRPRASDNRIQDDRRRHIMTTQPPIPPREGLYISPDSPPSADSSDEEGLVIQDTPVIDATKLEDTPAEEG